MNRLIILIIIPFFLCPLLSYADSDDKLNTEILDNVNSDLSEWIDNQFAQELDSFNIPGATFLLMKGDSILHMKGYGVTDISTNAPVNSESSIFCVASISKTFVATAIMQLVEDGKIQLDENINHYLKSFQIEENYDQPITIRHLLTHTGGFDERNLYTSVRNEDEVVPLAQHLKERMPPQIRPAGEIFTYSNYSYALLGLLVEETAGMPFHSYVSKNITQPLGMSFSGFKRDPDLREHYVRSYLQKEDQLIPYQPDFQLYYPAGSFCSTASDLSRYISMWLKGGNYGGVPILDSTTIVQMHQTNFKNFKDAESGWFLGFSEIQWNGFKVVSHRGEILGFASELALIPEMDLGLFISINASSLQDSKSRVFINRFFHKLLTRLLPQAKLEKDKPKTIPEMGSVSEPITSFTGTYRYTRYAQTTLDKLSVLVGFAPEVEITARGDTLAISNWNEEIIPISGLTFYDAKQNRYMAFGKDANGDVSYFFPNGTSAYHKLSWYEPINFQLFWIGSIILISLISLIVNGIISGIIRRQKSPLLKKVNAMVAFLILLFLLSMSYILITTDPMEFFYGIPSFFKVLLFLPFALILLLLFSIWLLIKEWQLKELRTSDRVFQAVFVLAVVAFIPWLHYWNLLGFNY